jgi:hypothetical protein
MLLKKEILLALIKNIIKIDKLWVEIISRYFEDL